MNPSSGDGGNRLPIEGPAARLIAERLTSMV